MFPTPMTGAHKRSPAMLLSLFLMIGLTSLYYFHSSISQHHKSGRILAELHELVAEFPSSDVKITDFATMASRAAVLAKVAELYVKNHALSRDLLRESVVRVFPWWNKQKLAYIPWEHDPAMDKIRTNETGIVVCVGDGNVKEALFLITNLRNVLGSQLPIEIAYAGDKDLSPHTRTFIYATGKNIHFLDLTKVFDNTLLGLSGWAIKPFALIASRFPRTILVDADVVFFSSPETAWDDYPGPAGPGVLLFHDRAVTMDNPRNKRQNFVAEQLSQLGRQPSTHLSHSSLFYWGFVGEEADSGVVFFDKSRPQLYITALFAAWMNIEDIRSEVTWDIFLGDKETYWLAAELLGVPYAFEPWQAGRLAEYLSEPLAKEFNTERLCSPHMVHATADGKDPFWANWGIWQRKDDTTLGFANWTHWYLGARIDKAIGALNSSHDAFVEPTSSGNETLELRRAEHKERVLATQPSWHWRDWEKDSAGCPQPDESRWKPLSSEIADVLHAIVEEAHTINYAWERMKRELNH
ncbi:hypothetical protein H2200_009207 [Cladophialophora chaetospira]|uniref:Glycosyltransferase family 71 protein n=1 Tax=Cladophialophora chaetospira TaxID=386627 RepID=A0AA38X3P7_9EURO|nr:hypothetical protein H2200_009207 [Cladophialophora chaetospira]